ncbi:hypothetical protein COU01_02345 [Candidatus Falkowbacteria bacterium CG10_big_fil_rev_8_21_14_0_10_44_15]|uniref:Uncharacterized protein n=1 Tax=Candidatus Falkowbacteria bacterium CG10_big_fil_rev_8_21_14_0_10_44_15 TaxID=1974569 RepID=A0A2H0UZS4_9BACT|nr:MAG: hypothetical protein COU01_02345 [Candidatus Falkowbacteria bacterium CG10_big_fil_rev_8_21_14_0_10_44_15]
MAEAGCVSAKQLEEIAVAAQQKINLHPVIAQLNEEGRRIIIRDALLKIETAGGVLCALSQQFHCSVAGAKEIAVAYIKERYRNPKSLVSALRQFGIADAEIIPVLQLRFGLQGDNVEQCIAEYLQDEILQKRGG